MANTFLLEVSTTAKEEEERMMQDINTKNWEIAIEPFFFFCQAIKAYFRTPDFLQYIFKDYKKKKKNNQKTNSWAVMYDFHYLDFEFQMLHC